jgi:glutaredoxin
MKEEVLYIMKNRGRSRFQRAAALLLVLSVTTCILVLPAAGAARSRSVEVHYFWGRGCTHCAAARAFLDELETRLGTQIEVHSYEVWFNPENKKIMDQFAAEYNINALGVPILFIGNQAWVGWREHMRTEIEDMVSLYLQQGSSAVPSENAGIHLPFLASVDVSTQPLLLTTALIAFVDGFNPCSLWVLTLLLGIVVHAGSRRKAAVVGITFLIITAATYGLFIAGLLNVFAYVGYLRWIQVVIGAFALAYGLINLKEFFWFHQGPSLTISERHKTGIYKGIRRIMNRNSLAGTMGATAAIALGATLAELPCTAGFPVIWSSILASQSVNSWIFAMLLLAYLLIYLLDELAVFFVFVFTMQVGRMEEKHGRLLKLAGGAVMVALALAMLLRPELMNSLNGSLIVFAFAALLALGIWGGHYTFGRIQQIRG